MYDMDFNPQNDKQAEDRAHRVGQTKDVTVHKLLSKHTIEQQILAMAEVRLRLDKRVSGVDGGDEIDEGEPEPRDANGMDPSKMTSLLKSALMGS
jgi:SWI/SNF-related matrix-associated actin-dependent regulator 1 of chromatin subfamily A